MENVWLFTTYAVAVFTAFCVLAYLRTGRTRWIRMVGAGIVMVYIVGMVSVVELIARNT